MYPAFPSTFHQCVFFEQRWGLRYPSWKHPAEQKTDLEMHYHFSCRCNFLCEQRRLQRMQHMIGNKKKRGNMQQRRQSSSSFECIHQEGDCSAFSFFVSSSPVSIARIVLGWTAVPRGFSLFSFFDVCRLRP